MSAEWTLERGRRFGILATVLGIAGLVQAAPLAGPIGALLVGLLTRDQLRQAGITEVPGTVRAGIYLGVAGLVVSVLLIGVYLLTR